MANLRDVFPYEPVIATIVRSGLTARCARASRLKPSCMRNSTGTNTRAARETKRGANKSTNPNPSSRFKDQRSNGAPFTTIKTTQSPNRPDTPAIRFMRAVQTSHFLGLSLRYRFEEAKAKAQSMNKAQFGRLKNQPPSKTPSPTR